MNGNHSGSGSANTPGGQNITGMDAHMAGLDALYIGDLQWVRLFSRLVSCLRCSEVRVIHVGCFSFAVDDG